MPIVSKSLGDGTQSVLLTIAILERFAERPGPVGISELSRDIGTSKSRIFRHLQTLVANDFVAVDGEGQYVVGSRMMAFCRAISDRYDIIGIAAKTMADLRDMLGHSVAISRIEPGGVRVLKSIASTSPIEVGIRPSTLLPFATSAQGKIALAFDPSAQNRPGTEIGRTYAALSPEQRAELDLIRERGWSEAQMRQGLKGLGAPLFGVDGRLVATLGLFDTLAEMGDDLDAKAGPLVEAARTLSGKLARSGYTAS